MRSPFGDGGLSSGTGAGSDDRNSVGGGSPGGGGDDDDGSSGGSSGGGRDDDDDGSSGGGRDDDDEPALVGGGAPGPGDDRNQTGGGRDRSSDDDRNPLGGGSAPGADDDRNTVGSGSGDDDRNPVGGSAPGPGDDRNTVGDGSPTGGSGDVGDDRQGTTGPSPLPEARALPDLNDATVIDLDVSDIRVDDGTAELTSSAQTRERRAQAEQTFEEDLGVELDRNDVILRPGGEAELDDDVTLPREQTEQQTRNRGDDLPRTPIGVGDADFREDTAARDAAESLSDAGRDFGGGLAGAALDAAGADDGADREILERIGGTVGAIPGDAAEAGVDVAQGFQSVAEVSVRGGPGAAVEQTNDLTADAVDAGLSGVDRLFDIDAGRRESGEGALIEVEDDARDDAAVTFTTAALSLPVGFAAGSAARTGAARAAGADTPDAGGVGQFVRDDRAQLGGGRRTTDTQIEQETIEVERVVGKQEETDVAIDDQPGVDVQTPDDRVTEDDLLAGRVRGAAAVEDDTVDVESLSPRERAEERVPEPDEFADPTVREQEVETLTERFREEQQSGADADTDVDAEVFEQARDDTLGTLTLAGAAGAAEQTASAATAAATQETDQLLGVATQLGVEEELTTLQDTGAVTLQDTGALQETVQDLDALQETTTLQDTDAVQETVQDLDALQETTTLQETEQRLEAEVETQLELSRPRDVDVPEFEFDVGLDEPDIDPIGTESFEFGFDAEVGLLSGDEIGSGGSRGEFDVF